MRTKLIENLKLWGLPILVGSSIFIFMSTFVTFVPKWFTQSYYTIFPEATIEKETMMQTQNLSQTVLNPNVTGPIGDTFGGLLGPVIGVLAAYLTFLAFWIQYRANRQQENYIKQQRFEDSFFRLLDHYKKIVDSMDIRETKNPLNIKAIGYECFRSMYLRFESDLKSDKSETNVNEIYNEVQNHFKHDLHHYFRFLYHILKFIKHSDISQEQKFKYTSILRATLSAYELVFVFYNCLHPNGKTHFKPLVEEFSFLKNMDESLIFNSKQKEYFDPLAFASSKEKASLLPAWTEKQKSNK